MFLTLLSICPCIYLTEQAAVDVRDPEFPEVGQLADNHIWELLHKPHLLRALIVPRWENMYDIMLWRQLYSASEMKQLTMSFLWVSQLFLTRHSFKHQIIFYLTESEITANQNMFHNFYTDVHYCISVYKIGKIFFMFSKEVSYAEQAKNSKSNYIVNFFSQ